MVAVAVVWKPTVAVPVNGGNQTTDSLTNTVSEVLWL
jgi:hypothetical protein